MHRALPDSHVCRESRHQPQESQVLPLAQVHLIVTEIYRSGCIIYHLYSDGLSNLTPSFIFAFSYTHKPNNNEKEQLCKYVVIIEVMNVLFLNLSICFFRMTVGSVQNHVGIAADKGKLLKPLLCWAFWLGCLYPLLFLMLSKLQPINCVDTEFQALL